MTAVDSSRAGPSLPNVPTISESALTVVALAYIAAILSVRLGTFPHLHGDEAWVGLFALRLEEQGLYTPHAMNVYTGSLFGWLAAQEFRILTPGVATLRLIGVVANVLAVSILAVHFHRRFGAAGAASWLVIVAATPMFLVKSRLAWEVYALQNLLISILLVLLRPMTVEGRYPFGRVLAFNAVVLAGALSHEIFLSVPVSLLFFAALMLAWDEESLLVPLLRLAVVSFAAAALVAAVKALLSDAEWQAHRLFYLTGLAALPIVATAAFVATAGADDLIRAAMHRRTWLKRLLGWLLAAGLAAFAIVHLKALVQIMSGVVVFERIVSWVPPTWLRLLLTAWAVLLLTVFTARAVSAARREGLRELSNYERLLALWPVAYMAIFTAVQSASSIRYFAILNCLLMASLAVALIRLAAHRRAVLVVGAAVILVLHISLWREILFPHERPPLQFKVGWTTETSSHFAGLDALFQVVEEEGICRFETDDFFLLQPLQFHAATAGVSCRPEKTLEAVRCNGCPEPPFVRWRLR